MFTKEMATLSKRQVHRRLDSLSSRAWKALWFSKQYGLELDTLCIKDNKGKQYPLKLPPSSSTSHTPLTHHRLLALPLHNFLVLLHQHHHKFLVLPHLLHLRPLVLWHLPHHKSLSLPTPLQQEPVVLPDPHHHTPQLLCHQYLH